MVETFDGGVLYLVEFVAKKPGQGRLTVEVVGCRTETNYFDFEVLPVTEEIQRQRDTLALIKKVSSKRVRNIVVVGVTALILLALLTAASNNFFELAP